MPAGNTTEPEFIFGVALDDIRGITLDGRRWLEVMGHSVVSRELAHGIKGISFRVAQVVGGKRPKDGIEQGAIVTTTVDRIVGVISIGYPPKSEDAF